jgi:signal transduction histidine kinase
MTQECGESELQQRLREAEKEASYYRTVAEETGRKTLRRVEQLEQLVAQKKQAEKELAGLLDKVKESNEELSDFAHVVSHDLREPLRKITCFGSILAESLRGSLLGEDAESLDIMIDGADRMRKMIDALLAYSRVTRQRVKLESVDLNQIVQQLRDFELAVLLDEKQVVFDVSEPLPIVQGDPVQISELLQNLIANGVKYQPKGAIPRITITARDAENGMVRVAVIDNGIGIESARQQNAFAMFKRVHTQGDYEGTGVGLAVCKKIIKRHGGQIGVESEPGQGSTFWFTLSAAMPRRAHQGVQAAANRA